MFQTFQQLRLLLVIALILGAILPTQLQAAPSLVEPAVPFTQDIERILQTSAGVMNKATQPTMTTFLSSQGITNAVSLNPEQVFVALQTLEAEVKLQTVQLTQTYFTSADTSREITPALAQGKLSNSLYHPLTLMCHIDPAACVTTPPPWTPPVLPYSQAEITQAFTQTDFVVQAMTPPFGQNEDEIGVCASEGPGGPAWVADRTANKVYLPGHHDENGTDFGAISNASILPNAESYEVRYELGDGYLRLRVDIFYDFELRGVTRYEVVVLEYTSNHSAQLRFGEYTVLDELRGAQLPRIGFVELNRGDSIVMARYAARHMCEFASYRFAQYGQKLNANNAGNILKIVGFSEPVGVYNPSFGVTFNDPEDMFTLKAYKDCEFAMNGTATTAALWRVNSQGAPLYIYESKIRVGGVTSCQAYIEASALDPLGRGQYAILLLQTYADPYGKYPTPGAMPGSESSTDIFTQILNTFRVDSPDGQETCIHKLTDTSGQTCSNIRTSTFGILATLLCYDFQYNEACTTLPNVLRAVMRARVGANMPKACQFQTEENGVLCRTNMENAPFIIWKYGTAMIASIFMEPFQSIVYVPPKPFIEQLIDDYGGMEPETGVFPTTIGESAEIVRQFFRVLLDRAFPGTLLNTRWNPAQPYIPINGGTDWVGVSSSYTENPDTLSIFQVTTGAARVCVVTRDADFCSSDQPNFGLAPNKQKPRTVVKGLQWLKSSQTEMLRSTLWMGTFSSKNFVRIRLALNMTTALLSSMDHKHLQAGR